jgi:hypothetical protein
MGLGSGGRDMDIISQVDEHILRIEIWLVSGCTARRWGTLIDKSGEIITELI